MAEPTASIFERSRLWRAIGGPRVDTAPPAELRALQLLVILMIAAASASVLFIPLYLGANQSGVAAYVALLSVSAVIAWAALYAGKAIAPIGTGLLIAQLVTIVGTGWLLGGLAAPGSFWLPLPVVMSYVLMGRRGLVPVLICGVIGLVILAFAPPLPASLDDVVGKARTVSLVVAMVMTGILPISVERSRRVATRTLEATLLQLRAARDTALEAHRAQSELVASLSHELRTPLAAIIGLSEMMRVDGQPPSSGAVAAVHSGAKHLLVIVDELLDLTRLNAGGLKLNPAPMNLRALANEVVGLFASRAAEKGITLTLHAAEALPPVRADATRLRQVWTNLLDNAVKFTERGSVEFHLAATARADGDIDIAFRVVDTGIGIPPAEQARIFLPFHQADASSSKRYGGAGLGLAIAQKLVALMGGGLVVEATGHLGTTLAGNAVCARAPETDAHAGATVALQGRRVLVADDDPVGLRLLTWMLTTLGCSVDTASDGAEALRLAMAAPYDVALLDCHMPGVDGYSAARQLRVGGKTLPIIALTASSGADEEAQTRAAGMDELLRKPVNLETLRSVLGRQLGRAPGLARSPQAADAGLVEVAPRVG